MSFLCVCFSEGTTNMKWKKVNFSHGCALSYGREVCLSSASEEQ